MGGLDRGSRRNITIEDVARLAGVSRQTVSRVLNNKGELNEDTRKRILTIIEELGYEPSTTAQSLSRGRTNTLGLILPDITNPFYPEIASSVELNARALGYRVLLCNTREDPEEEARSLRLLRQQRVDGLILCGSRMPTERLQPLVEAAGPCVLVNSTAVAPQVSVVRHDFADGARQAVEHLVQTGHRRIGMLTLNSISLSATEKLRGFTDALAALGAECDPALIVTTTPTVRGGMEATRQLLLNGVDAVFAHSDTMAIGAMLACEQTDVRVPHDCAVVGFGDHPYSFALRPALSTVNVQLTEMGAQAIKLLIQLIEGDQNVLRDVILPARLVVRDSSPAR